MLHKNPRINVTFEEDIAELLADMARKKNKSIASVVRDLTYAALEMHEDYCLAKMAERIEKVGGKLYSHEEAWKNI